MSATACHIVRESAADFALGALTGRDRAEVVAHLDGCAGCRALVAEHASVADALLELIPEAEPAADITPAVLSAMRPVRRRWRRRIAALAAAAIVAIGTGTAVTVAVVSGGDDGSGSVAAPALRSAPMVGAGDLTVGRVVATSDRPPTITVSVDYWLPDGSYQVAARDRTGEAAQVGTLEVTKGRGAWTGSTLAVEHPVAVSLVDQSGRVVCDGSLP
jgi:predicted anti-sigma-YlaC factor YlaD